MGVGIAIAAGVGIAIAVQVALVGDRAATVPALAVSALVHVGGLGIALVWLTLRREWGPIPEAIGGWWWVVAGACGWVIVGGFGAAATRTGVAAALAVAVTVQLAAGMTWDAVTGTAPIDLRGLVGLATLALGAFLVAGRV